LISAGRIGLTGTVELVELQRDSTWHTSAIAPGTANQVTSLNTLGDGRYVLATSNDGRIRWMDLEHREDHFSWRGESQAIFSSALSADGSVLATGGDRKIRLWDVPTGDQLANLEVGMLVTDLAFTLDGSTLTWGGGDGSVHFERAR
jgi:WD40 repeat protein